LNPPLPGPAPPAHAEELMAVARSVVFSPVGGEGVVEMAVRRLGEAIAIGLIEAGEQLPSETVLAERLGIATVTLRDALAVLAEAGFVETRRGRGGGPFARRPKPTRARAALPWTSEQRLASAADRNDLNVFMRAVAGAAAALAAERRSDEEARDLVALVDEIDALPDNAAFRRADGRFHIAIAGVARSARLVALEISLQAEVHYLLVRTPDSADSRARANAAHRGIALAIEAGAAGAARRLAEQHARRVGAFIEAGRTRPQRPRQPTSRPD
jgi:DNA-binding FadR family transcriptional regulator